MGRSNSTNEIRRSYQGGQPRSSLNSDRRWSYQGGGLTNSERAQLQGVEHRVRSSFTPSMMDFSSKPKIDSLGSLTDFSMESAMAQLKAPPKRGIGEKPTERKFEDGLFLVRPEDDKKPKKNESSLPKFLKPSSLKKMFRIQRSVGNTAGRGR